jgi:hypothetical protein
MLVCGQIVDLPFKSSDRMNPIARQYMKEALSSEMSLTTNRKKKLFIVIYYSYLYHRQYLSKHSVKW